MTLRPEILSTSLSTGSPQAMLIHGNSRISRPHSPDNLRYSPGACPNHRRNARVKLAVSP